MKTALPILSTISRTLYLTLLLPFLLLSQVCGVVDPASNQTPTGYWNMSGARLRLPEAIFASPPSSPLTGQMWLFQDADTAGVCSGSGSGNKPAMCQWTGSAWLSIGGGGGGSGSGTSYWSKTIVFGGQNSAINVNGVSDTITEGPRVPVTFANGVTLTSCTIGATTGPSGAPLTIWVLKNGTQVASCIINSGATTGSSTPGVAFAAADHITLSAVVATWATAPRGVSAELLFTINP